MQDKLYIDGMDVFVRYGAFVEQYGYKQVIQMPAFKKIESTEWPEFDGEEYDLTAPVFDTRSLQIQFCITDIALAGDLFEILSDKSYHIFDFKELRKSYKLRLVSNGSLSSNIKLGKLTLSFSDDFAPVTEEDAERLEETGELDDYNLILNQQPYIDTPSEFKQSGYELDDIDFSRFGIYVVGNTDNNIQKAPNVRDNLSISSDAKPGIDYDGESVMYRTKDVKMNLFIHAADIEEFWIRWNMLFTILAQPEERKLYLDKTSEEFNCFYKKCSVSKFEILKNGHVWCEFSITLTFTDSRPLGFEEFLALESGELIIMENNEECFINLKQDAYN